MKDGNQLFFLIRYACIHNKLKFLTPIVNMTLIPLFNKRAHNTRLKENYILLTCCKTCFELCGSVKMALSRDCLFKPNWRHWVVTSRSVQD